jgi:hypothetical protein
MLLSSSRTGVLVLVLALAGCHSNPACSPDQEYLHAVDRPRLQLPGSLSQSERMAPLVIPPTQAEVQKLDPQPRCLDEPPSFYARKATAAVGAGAAGATAVAVDSAENVVRSWATNWAARNPEGVIKLYSPSFQAPGVAGSAEFLDQRRGEITNGPAVSAKLEDMQVQAHSADRRTVTFVQKIGGDPVKKQLVLVREGGNWRIVAETTFETS